MAVQIEEKERVKFLKKEQWVISEQEKIQSNEKYFFKTPKNKINKVILSLGEEGFLQMKLQTEKRGVH